MFGKEAYWITIGVVEKILSSACFAIGTYVVGWSAEKILNRIINSVAS